MLSLDEFNHRLTAEFSGRLRARYVPHKDEYHIEQKVGREVLAPFRVNSDDDDAIRARDGYAYVMTIRRGTRMPCPTCGATLKVPTLKTAEVKCDYCFAKGYNGTVVAAYYPLGDALIQQLRSIDPVLGHSEDRLRVLDEYNKSILDSRKRHVDNIVEAGAHEAFRWIVGIPQFGYTSAKHWFDKKD